MEPATILSFVVIYSILSLTRASKCQVSVSNIALQGHVMSSFHAESIHDCHEKCKEKMGCLSINFYLDSSICDLNNRTVAAKPQKKVVDSNAVYFERPKPAAIGSHEEIPAESCMEIKNATRSSFSGQYWVKHAQQTKQTYCNMTTGAAQPCAISPCKNQGKCHEISEISYSCTCVSPFIGKNCETKDYCSPNPCLNGGSCVNGVSDFSCTCTAGFAGKACATVSDVACSSYTTITDATRNMNYGNPADQCDKTIAIKWYRLSGAAGVKMPTSCVPKQRCSTDATGWLSQPHPTTAEGIVSKKVCFHWDANCCTWETTIRVRNCGDFYVYEFKPTSNCQLRYCGTN